MFSRRVKNCGSIFILVLTAGRVWRVQSRREGSREPVIWSLHDITDIHQVSNVLLFSLTYVKLQTKKVEVTSRNNYRAKLCLPKDKQVSLTGSICDDEERTWV